MNAAVTASRGSGRHRIPRGSRLFALLLLGCCLPLGQHALAEAQVLLTRQQITELPMAGPAWLALERRAHGPIGIPTVADQDSPSNVNTLALALYAVRTQDAGAAETVRRVCLAIIGTEKNARVLAIGRELGAFVIAADLVGLSREDDERFRAWLRSLQRREFQGRTLRSAHEDRPNNWGTHAGATRIAVAAYLNDRQEIEAAAHVFRGWLGDADGWQGFEFGASWWQPRGTRRFGINPAGAVSFGQSIDGVLPDDQRRGGPFRWPPPKVNYVYEALQGAVLQAMLLERQGYDPWSWGNRALLRAVRWLHDEADFPAVGDDGWIPHVINHAYGTDFPAPVPASPGKGMGYTDWTHGRLSP